VAAIVALMVVTVMPIASLTPTAGALSGDEQYFVTQINALRSSRGLGSLALDGNMIDLATAHTAEMMGAGSLFHAPRLSIGVSGGWAKLGENVGRGSSAEIVWSAFVNSPAHYANLVDPSFTHVGISVMWDGGGQLWTTQRFVSRSGEVADDAPAPRTEREPVVRAPRDAEPQVSEAEPVPEDAAPPAPPPPPADPGRISTVLDVLHASPD
jgi:hypothetical protein